MIHYRKYAALALTALFLPSCSTVGTMTERTVLIDPAEGATLLGQCSRPGPTNAADYFTPSSGEVTAIETSVARTLEANRARYAANASLAFDWPRDPSLYNRQYVGFVMDGERKIYGNFVPARVATSSDRPVLICDGGPDLFGVQFDIATGEVDRIDFDGSRGGPMLEPITR